MDRRDAWVGSRILTGTRLRASLGWHGTSSIRAKWRSLSSARASTLKKDLTQSDIVREAIYRQQRRLPTMGWLRSLPVCRLPIPCLPEYNSAHVTDIECSGDEHSCESIAENSLGSVSSRQPRHNLLPGRAGALLQKRYRTPDLRKRFWWSAQVLLDWSPDMS